MSEPVRSYYAELNPAEKRKAKRLEARLTADRVRVAFEIWRGDYLDNSPRSSDDDDLAEAFAAGWQAALATEHKGK